MNQKKSVPASISGRRHRCGFAHLNTFVAVYQDQPNRTTGARYVGRYVGWYVGRLNTLRDP